MKFQSSKSKVQMNSQIPNFKYLMGGNCDIPSLLPEVTKLLAESWKKLWKFFMIQGPSLHGVTEQTELRGEAFESRSVNLR